MAPPRQSRNNSTSLFLRNVPDSCAPDDLRHVFHKFGRITDVYIPVDHYTRRSRGFAYVQFEDRRDAEEAMYEMNDFRLFGNRLDIEYARSPHEMKRRDDGGFRSRRSRSCSGERRRPRSRSGDCDRRRPRSRSDSGDRRRPVSRSNSGDRRRPVSRSNSGDRRRPVSRSNSGERRRPVSRSISKDRRRRISENMSGDRRRQRSNSGERMRPRSNSGNRMRPRSNSIDRRRQRSANGERRSNSVRQSPPPFEGRRRRATMSRSNSVNRDMNYNHVGN